MSNKLCICLQRKTDRGLGAVAGNLSTRGWRLCSLPCCGAASSHIDEYRTKLHSHWDSNRTGKTIPPQRGWK